MAEGNGPVNALMRLCAKRWADATRSSLASISPTSRSGCWTRSAGTAAVTRVLIDSTDGDRTWTTIGVSENVIEASWEALSDRSCSGCYTPVRGSTNVTPVAQPDYVPIVPTDQVNL